MPGDHPIGEATDQQPSGAAPQTDILLPTSIHLVDAIDVSIAPSVTRLLITEDWFRDELQKSS